MHKQSQEERQQIVLHSCELNKGKHMRNGGKDCLRDQLELPATATHPRPFRAACSDADGE